jgi:hypothetical protein
MIGDLIDRVVDMLFVVKGQVAVQPWPSIHGWGDDSGDGTTFAQAYHPWVAANIDRLDDDLSLCNWFPLHLLVEYAAAKSLPIKLRFWPGAAPTDGRERKWDTNTVLTHNSHGGLFKSKDQFFLRARATVTARMIGELNTVAIARANAKVGDLIIEGHGEAWYWHAAVITGVFANSVATMSGTTPARVPDSDAGRRPYSNATIEQVAYEGSPRRWKFEQFG